MRALPENYIFRVESPSSAVCCATRRLSTFPTSHRFPCYFTMLLGLCPVPSRVLPPSNTNQPSRLISSNSEQKVERFTKVQQTAEGRHARGSRTERRMGHLCCCVLVPCCPTKSAVLRSVKRIDFGSSDGGIGSCQSAVLVASGHPQEQQRDCAAGAAHACNLCVENCCATAAGAR